MKLVVTQAGIFVAFVESTMIQITYITGVAAALGDIELAMPQT